MKFLSIKSIVISAMLLGGASIMSSCNYQTGDNCLKEYLTEKDITQR